MLEGIVQHNDIGLKFADRQHAGIIPVPADNHRYAMQPACHKIGLITRLLRIHPHCLTVADNPAVFFGSTVIAPADNNH